MGLDFFYSMMELGPEKMREFGTDMVYLAQKKEDVNKFCTDLIYLAAKQGRGGGFSDTGYGPFGKIY